jgi:predicted TIM-barrel fold metal-dependent hydrolase
MIDVNAYLGHFAFRQLRHNTGAGLVKLMDRFGVQRAVVSSAAAITYRNCQAGNEETAAEVEAHRSRLIPFAVLNPTYAGWEDDLKLCHEQFGMKGVRLYPRWHNYTLADPRCRALAEAAAARKMTVAIPVRVEDRRQHGWLVNIPDLEMDEIAGLIRACPSTRFLIQNAGGLSGTALGNRAAGIPSNFAIEITRVPVEFSNEVGRLVELLGEDRVLLGTGMPFHYPGPALVRVEVLQASEAVKQKIRKTNAERWLGL